MTIEAKPLKEEIIRQLFALANTPFLLGKFRERWESFGWKHKRSDDDVFGFKVKIPKHWPLSVDPLRNAILGAWVVFCYWEDDSPRGGKKRGKAKPERLSFDAAFDTARDLSESILGSPAIVWTDNDELAFRAVIWEGSHGLLILQQACFDPQFGFEINLWLLDCPLQEFQPATPLIDRISAYMRERHDKAGFPNLEW